MVMFMLGRGMHLLNDGKVLPLLLSGCSVTNGALIWLIKGMHRGGVVSPVFGMVINKVAGDTVVVDDGDGISMQGAVAVAVAVDDVGDVRAHHGGCCGYFPLLSL